MTVMSLDQRIPRREFLRRTRNSALGLGVGVSAYNLFLNKTKAATGEQPSEFIRIGVIGTGSQGKANTNAIIKNVIAVCDVDKTRVVEAQKLVQNKTGRAVTAYSDYRKLLDNKEIDAVLIATPDHWHTLPAVHACQAGKDVYCEKPLTLTVHEGWALVKAARKYTRIVQTGSQQRSWSDQKFCRAAEYVRSGRIGDIKAIRVGLPGVNWMKDPPVPDSEPPAELDYDM